MKGNDRAVGRGRWCTDANKLSNQVSRGGTDERASHMTVELCACHGLEQGHLQRDVLQISCRVQYSVSLVHTGLSPEWTAAGLQESVFPTKSHIQSQCPVI